MPWGAVTSAAKVRGASIMPFERGHCEGIGIEGTTKNALFPQLRRQRRARIIRYDPYTAVVRAVLPCTHEKMTIFRGPFCRTFKCLDVKAMLECVDEIRRPPQRHRV